MIMLNIRSATIPSQHLGWVWPWQGTSEPNPAIPHIAHHPWVIGDTHALL